MSSMSAKRERLLSYLRIVLAGLRKPLGDESEVVNGLTARAEDQMFR